MVLLFDPKGGSALACEEAGEGQHLKAKIFARRPISLSVLVLDLAFISIEPDDRYRVVIQVKDDIPFVKRISLISILILVWKNRAGKRNRLGDDDSALIRKRLPASGNAELG